MVSPLPAPPDAGFFARHTVGELAEELRAGRVSPVDLLEHAVDAVTRLDPLLNAFVTIDAERARKAAHQAAQELASGFDRGPLHGIPVAIKDVVDTAGLRTTMGSRHFANHVPERDAECVRGLRRAGAVIIGKTTTHEFAYGPTGDRSANGASRNPYRPDRASGGSSGGSAVAVAAGIVPLAVGTDTGGSVRIPASCCGVVGLKPTVDAVSTRGVHPVSPSLDTVGPMARTPADCRLLWQALAADVHEAPHERGPSGQLRIGWLAPDAFFPTDEAVSRISRAAAETLRRRAGGRLDDAVVPDALLRHSYATLQSAEVYAIHADRMVTAPGLYDDEVLARLQGAARVVTSEYGEAQEVRRRARGAVLELLRHYDLLALPSVPVLAPLLDARTMDVAGRPVDVRDALLSLTSAWSVVGLPALSTPAGLVDGLPVGLQLVAAPGGESLLLSAAERLYEEPPQPLRSR